MPHTDRMRVVITLHPPGRKLIRVPVRSHRSRSMPISGTVCIVTLRPSAIWQRHHRALRCPLRSTSTNATSHYVAGPRGTCSLPTDACFRTRTEARAVGIKASDTAPRARRAYSYRLAGSGLVIGRTRLVTRHSTRKVTNMRSTGLLPPVSSASSSRTGAVASSSNSSIFELYF